MPAVLRRAKKAPPEPRPPMPPELLVYNPADWGAAVAPLGGDWVGWERASRAAYQAYLAAVEAWQAEHGHKPPPELVVGDEPWCGEFTEHECGGADCLHRLTRDEGNDDDGEA